MTKESDMTRIRKNAGWIAAALSALVATIAVPALAQTGDADHRTPANSIDWHACADTDFTNMQCGSIQVPVDWSHPAPAAPPSPWSAARRTTGPTARAPCS